MRLEFPEFPQLLEFPETLEVLEAIDVSDKKVALSFFVDESSNLKVALSSKFIVNYQP